VVQGAPKVSESSLLIRDMKSHGIDLSIYSDHAVEAFAGTEAKCHRSNAPACSSCGMEMRLALSAVVRSHDNALSDDIASSQFSTSVCTQNNDAPDVSEIETSSNVDRSRSEKDLSLSFRPILVSMRPENSIIFFDWDDTLLPTAFIKDVHHTCPPKYKYSATPRHNAMQGLPCFPAFQRHATLVQRVLTTARSVAHVAIVTLADRSWLSSSDQYLPGLKLAELLKELEIPVYHALEHSHQNNEGDRDDYLIDSKCRAMTEFLKHIYPGNGTRINALCIGDSLIEKDAIKKAVDTFETNNETSVAWPPLCKRVKLIENPSLKQLSVQLDFITNWMDHMVAHDTCFDLTADLNSKWMTQAECLLAPQSLVGG